MTGSELFVPGRLCLFGEHSDWAGGYRREDSSLPTGMCMVTGTDQGLHATAEQADGVFAIRQVPEDTGSLEFAVYPADPGVLREVAGDSVFDSYAAGVAALVLERFPGRGLRLDVTRRTLPLKKGLSSSAAICVLTARAFDRTHGLGLSVEDEMELAYRGEILTGSACGRMDQACAYGRVPLLLEFDGDIMSVRQLAPGREVPMLVVDLRAAKDTRLILSELNRAFTEGDPGLREALGPFNHRILEGACRAVEEGDLEALGSLMTLAQEFFDRMVAPACPDQLASPKLHGVLCHPAALRLALGGKGVGSQGDGTAQFVCRDGESRRELAEALEHDLDVRCIELTIPRLS